MKLSANKVAQHLDISVKTLEGWYSWYNNPEMEKPENTPVLPPYEQVGVRTQRWWKEEDLEQLEIFKNWIPKGRGGVMGAYNKRYWSKERQPKKG